MRKKNTKKTSFQHCDQATRCNKGLLPGITVRNMIGPHICWGSWRAEAATVHRPGHTRPSPACYWLCNRPLTWCTASDCFTNQIPLVRRKTGETSLGVDSRLSLSEVKHCTNVCKNLKYTDNERSKTLHRREKLRRRNNSNSIMSCSNIPSKCVRNLSRLQAWRGCQLSCQQPGLVLRSSCVTAGTHAHVTEHRKTSRGHTAVKGKDKFLS